MSWRMTPRKEKNMVAFYVDKIRNQGWELEAVPKLWRAKVQAALAE